MRSRFIKEKMSIVSSAEIIAYTGASSYDVVTQAIHEGIEQMIKNECDKAFESTTYLNELYDGLGSCRMRLRHVPITAVSRVSCSLEECIGVKNTLTDATTASVVVDATNVTLTVSGGVGNSTNVITIASYATLSALVTKINTYSAQGWSAEISQSYHNDKKTTSLIPQQLDVTSWDVAESYSYLIIGVPISFKLIAELECIEASFPYGSQNISVSYTAGSTPKDIAFAVKVLVKYLSDQNTNNAEGVKRWSTGDVEMEYFGALEANPMIKGIIERNRRVSM
jgi:hypothetical protein